MKKQKLIEKINKIAIETPFPKSKIVDHLEVIKLIEQLDEPEKVTIPQFVVDWIEVCKEHLTTSLYTAMNPNFMRENNQSFDLISWIKKTSNQETFARAWLGGYEVEKEKRYRVKLKSNSKEIDYLVNTERNGLRFYSVIYTQRREHTRKELEEAGFGWVFDCPGIEIEEVE